MFGARRSLTAASMSGKAAAMAGSVASTACAAATVPGDDIEASMLGEACNLLALALVAILVVANVGQRAGAKTGDG